ncbi:MAG: nicotinamide mononucleotide transporter [Erysipelotrichaceae bacterium]|nr:nicotinamide mononucleotide transporter [Erysipelotrichaceae bacterium]
MKEKLKSYLEPNQRIRTAETIALVMLLLGSLFSYVRGTASLHKDPGELTYIETTTLARDFEAEDYDEDSTSCDVIFANEEGQLIKTYTYEDYENLKDESIDAYVYETDDGIKLFFDHKDPNPDVIKGVYCQTMATALMPVFNLANALIILAASVAVMLFYGKFFTAYEKSWFLGIMVLATIFAVLFPEESANGVNGIWIMLLYLLDTFLNILCELLISKQSRYNFLVSVLVEITEIIISIVLMYRFATMTVTLLFWLPIDILSFINWTRHKDDKEEELTVVRRLKGYQEVLVILAIGVWTVVVGYFISGLDIRTDFLGNNKQLETIMIYLDACASAVGIANGLFIFFRLREQWIAWYICALLEAIMNILAGQYVLLVLKLGYFTNTTYGYIKWSRYIGTHKEEKASIL